MAFLPESCRPAWVTRDDGVTLCAIDARTTRVQVVEWAVATLTEAEQNAYRAAYSQPAVGSPLDDAWMSDDLFPMDVPRSLVMPLDPAKWKEQQIPRTRAG